jgi:hypothetical protein
MQMNLVTELPQLYLFQIESSNWNNGIIAAFPEYPFWHHSHVTPIEVQRQVQRALLTEPKEH